MAVVVTLVGGDTAERHALSVDEAVASVASDLDRGLSMDEVARRTLRFGPNVLPAGAGPGWPRRLLGQFHNPLIYVLIVAGTITAGLAEYVDSAVIFAVVVSSRGRCPPILPRASSSWSRSCSAPLCRSCPRKFCGST